MRKQSCKSALAESHLCKPQYRFKPLGQKNVFRLFFGRVEIVAQSRVLLASIESSSSDAGASPAYLDPLIEAGTESS